MTNTDTSEVKNMTPESVYLILKRLRAGHDQHIGYKQTIFVHKNPDGPEAAQVIEALEAERDALRNCVRWFASTEFPSSGETPVDCIQIGINKASEMLRHIGDDT